MANISPQVKMKQLAAKIKKEVERGAGKGLEAGMYFLLGRTKETVNIQAPIKQLREKTAPGSKKKGKIIGYRATTHAIAGAPVRKVSGQLQRALSVAMVSSVTTGKLRGVIGTNARSADGFSYPRYHELNLPGMKGSGEHPFIVPTIKQWKKSLAKIIGRNVKIGLGG